MTEGEDPLVGNWLVRLVSTFRRTTPLSPFVPVREGLRKGISAFAERCGEGLVVDVGCGQRPYEYLFPGSRYVGLDLPVSGRSASLKRPDVWFDGRSIPLRPKCANVVLCTQVIEHVEDPQQFFASLSCVLKTGGHLILSGPQNEPVFEKPYDRFRFTLDGLKMLCSNNGLQVIDAKPNLGFWQSAAFDILSMIYLQLRKRSRLAAYVITAPISVSLNFIAFMADRFTSYNRNVNSWIIYAVKL
jgi:SAM-dependent methyltransferase